MDEITRCYKYVVTDDVWVRLIRHRQMSKYPESLRLKERANAEVNGEDKAKLPFLISKGLSVTNSLGKDTLNKMLYHNIFQSC
jgi:hypothetical protein